MPTKRDTLLASLAGSGTVSDRLYAQEKTLAGGLVRTLNDLLKLNAKDLNIIQ